MRLVCATLSGRARARPRVATVSPPPPPLATTSRRALLPAPSPPRPPRRSTFPPRPRPPSVRARSSPRVDDIRVNDQNPGLRDYEASALRLLDKLTNGMAVEINESGTALKYKPGVVTGGRRISHDCGGSRGIGYFLEMVLCVVSLRQEGCGCDPHRRSPTTRRRYPSTRFAPSRSRSSSDSSASRRASRCRS